jgi:hypothetical protein
MSPSSPEKQKRKREVSSTHQQERPSKKPALVNGGRIGLKNLPPLKANVVVDNSELAPVLSMSSFFLLLVSYLPSP